MTIVYGNTGSGGPGAAAGTTAGANSFQTQERSTAGGVLANIAASPTMNVYAADGSGTMTTPTANVVNGSTQHDRLHLQGKRGRRHLERDGHAHGARRVAGADRGEHDVVRRRAQLRRADGHGLGTHARRERHVHDHLRACGGTDDAAGHRHGRRRSARRPAVRSPGSPPLRRSTSTRPTAQARSPPRRRRSATDPPATPRRSRTRRRPAGRARQRDDRRPGGVERAEHHARQRRVHRLEHGHCRRSRRRRSRSPP